MNCSGTYNFLKYRHAIRSSVSMAARYNSTAAVDPKISTIVDQIAGLTLLETADLVSLLKVCQHALLLLET